MSVLDHPELLYGYDGEPPYFVRADLANTPEEAANIVAEDHALTVEAVAAGMRPIDSMEKVWMVEHEYVECPNPDDCEDDDCPGHEDEGIYHCVPEQRDGAVLYWRWDW